MNVPVRGAGRPARIAFALTLQANDCNIWGPPRCKAEWQTNRRQTTGLATPHVAGLYGLASHCPASIREPSQCMRLPGLPRAVGNKPYCSELAHLFLKRNDSNPAVAVILTSRPVANRRPFVDVRQPASCVAPSIRNSANASKNNGTAIFATTSPIGEKTMPTQSPVQRAQTWNCLRRIKTIGQSAGGSAACQGTGYPRRRGSTPLPWRPATSQPM